MKIEQVINKANGRVWVELIKEASFDEWLAYLFDRPECNSGKHWTFGDHGPVWDAHLELTAEFIARTYEDPDYWMPHFSPAQIADGLQYTWNPSLSDVVFAVRDEPVPWLLRQRAIRALVPLYQRCFAKLCSPGLSHLDECRDNPVNGVCYKYWDVCPFYGQPENPKQRELDDECLRVMEVTVQIDHDACRESALHGLGHWALYYPSRVAAIIEEGLKPVRYRLRPQLLQYAKAAACGSVV